MRKRVSDATFEARIVLGVLTIALAGAIAGITVWLVNYDRPAEAAVVETAPAETGESQPAETTGATTEAETEAAETEPAETEAPETAGGQGDAAAGAEVFASAGCTACHTLSAAGATGTVGPNLDDAKPPFELVVERVTNGAGAMPSFSSQLDEQQIQDVAAYVVQSTSG